MYLIQHTYKNEEILRCFIEELPIKKTASVLVQCFDSHQTVERISEARQALLLLLPNVHFIGTSTAGIVDNGHIHDHEIILSFSIFDQSDILTCAFTGVSIDRIGDELVRNTISERTRLMIVFANTYRFDSTRFLEMIQRKFPQLIVCGGNAGDDYRVSTYKGIFIPMRFKVCLNSFYKPLQIVFPFL